MTLDKLKPHESAKITAVGGSGALRHHLLDMGLTPQTEVTLQKVAPMGDPVQFELRGYELTLRLDEARKIEVGTPYQRTKKPSAGQVRHRPAAHPGMGELRKSKDYHIYEHAKAAAADKKLTFALAGNDGTIRSHPEATVTDLPGIYSLSPYSSEEIVTRSFLLDNKPDGIINIVDATNIERNLYLTMQMMELGIPMVLALNMMDEVRANGGTVHVNELEQALGIPVVPISAAKNEGIDELIDHAIHIAHKYLETKILSCIVSEEEGIDELIDHAIHIARYQETPRGIDFCQDSSDKNDPVAAVHRCIHATALMIEPNAKRAGLPVRFAATKLIEKDPLIEKALALSDDNRSAFDQIVSVMEKDSGLDREAALANMRFSFLENLCSTTVVRPHESKEHKRSMAIDRFLTGKYTAIPCFAGIMGLIFIMTFSWIGAWLSDGMTVLVDACISWLDAGLSALQINPVVHSLVVDGIANGVGSVLSFLPTIVTLFFFLSILEDTGYMARVAFIMDRPLRKLGLSGRSFVPMLVGFGCSVPAIMATRTLSSERDRRMTILLTPFMSCSAKLPIYTMMISAFFPRQYRALAMIGLYLFGILCGILYAVILKVSRFKGEPVPFVMELPNYRLPSAKSVVHLIWEKAKGFIQKAFTIIFAASIVIWFLQTFDARFNVVSMPESSLLAALGSIFAPLFAPLGFADWRVSTALITGFTAKESVVSTLTLLLGGEVSSIGTLFTPFTAVVFLVFVLLYTPCVAAIATVKREMGSTRAAIMTALTQCVIAWLIAFAVRCVGLAFGLA